MLSYIQVPNPFNTRYTKHCFHRRYNVNSMYKILCAPRPPHQMKVLSFADDGGYHGFRMCQSLESVATIQKTSTRALNFQCIINNCTVSFDAEAIPLLYCPAKMLDNAPCHGADRSDPPIVSFPNRHLKKCGKLSFNSKFNPSMLIFN